jgi:hypothetical protein
MVPGGIDAEPTVIFVIVVLRDADNASIDEVIAEALCINSNSVLNVWSNAPLRNSYNFPTLILCVLELSTIGITLPVLMLVRIGNCEILGIS